MLQIWVSVNHAYQIVSSVIQQQLVPFATKDILLIIKHNALHVLKIAVHVNLLQTTVQLVFLVLT
jgi:hypothetical protein